MSVKQAPGWLRDHSRGTMTAGITLALLHLGRSVLIPLALAIMVSLLVAPLVRALRRLRVGRISSVLVAVVALAVLCMGVAAGLGTQFCASPRAFLNTNRMYNTSSRHPLRARQSDRERHRFRLLGSSHHRPMGRRFRQSGDRGRRPRIFARRRRPRRRALCHHQNEQARQVRGCAPGWGLVCSSPKPCWSGPALP